MRLRRLLCMLFLPMMTHASSRGLLSQPGTFGGAAESMRSQTNLPKSYRSSHLTSSAAKLEDAKFARRLLAPNDGSIVINVVPSPPGQTTVQQSPPRSFDNPISNNVAFVGVAMALGLIVSCCWCACVAYRRHRSSNSGQLRYSPNGGAVLRVLDFGSGDQQFDDLTLKFQPIMVIQPNGSLAYTFRELDTSENAGDSSSSTNPNPFPAHHDRNLRRDSITAAAGAAAPQSSGSRTAPASGYRRSNWPQTAPGSGPPPHPTDPINSQLGLREPALNSRDDSDSQVAVSTLRQAGILGRQQQTQHIAVPVLLEWDLRTEVDNLDLNESEATKLLGGPVASALQDPDGISQLPEHSVRGTTRQLGNDESLSRKNGSFRNSRTYSGRLGRSTSGSQVAASEVLLSTTTSSHVIAPSVEMQSREER